MISGRTLTGFGVSAALLLAVAISVPGVAASNSKATDPGAQSVQVSSTQLLVDPKPVEADSGAGEDSAPVVDAIMAIGSWMDRHRGLLSNYSGMVRQSDGEVTVLWAHEVPQEFSDFVRDRGLTGVTVTMAPYSSDEINSEIKRLASSHSEVLMWSASKSYDGIVATILTGSKSPDFSDSAFPVTIEYGDGESLPL